MAILFDFYPSPSTSGSDHPTEENYHARVVGGQTLEMDGLVQHISNRCTLTKGDIKAVLSELSEELASGLLAGNRVNIPGIGYFSLSLKAPDCANPQTTHAQHIQVKKIEYRADADLKERVKNHAVFQRSPEKVHSSSWSHAEIDKLLSTYFQQHGFITRKEFSELCHLTRNTAQRHLTRLLEEGKLVNRNIPHNPIYEPAEGYYGKR